MSTQDFDNLDEFDDLREFDNLIQEVKAAGDVPEPSPLFWNHLSARVRDAVDHEPVPGPWWMLYWRPVMLAVGSLAVVVVAVMLRTGGVTPSTTTVDAGAAVASAADAAADVEVTEMWRMLELASPSVEIGSAESGLMPTQYATDQAIQALTPAQREALVKLLRKEMGVTE